MSSTKQRKQKPAAFKLFKNDKLNTEWPRGYNLLLGYSELNYRKTKVFLPDYSIIF